MQAPGSVQARREREPQRALADRARAHAGHRHQRPQARLARARERLQAAAHERAVLAEQGHRVGHRGQRHEVEVLVQRARVAARRQPHRLGQPEGHRGGASGRVDHADRAPRGGEIAVGDLQRAQGHGGVRAGAQAEILGVPGWYYCGVEPRHVRH